MSDGTKINYCTATVNAIRGCTRCSPGCDHCFAIRSVAWMARMHPEWEQLRGLVHDGEWTGALKFDETQLAKPLRWKSRVILWNSLADTFHPDVRDGWRDRMFAVMALTPQHQHLVLTKRVEEASRYLIDFKTGDRVYAVLWEYNRIVKKAKYLGWMIPNVWLGVTICNQAEADTKLPILAELAAAGWKTWVSIEPMLAPIDLDVDCGRGVGELAKDWLRSVICGGESGPGARPMHPDWVRSIRDHCAAAGVPLYVKQIHIGGRVSTDPQEWPEEFRIRSLPWRVNKVR